MRELDAALFRLVYAALSGRVTLLVMAALTVLGSGWVMLAFLPLFAMNRTRRFGAALVGTLVATSAVVALVKAFVGRLRPCAGLPDIHARVFAAPTDPSFPSGHAAGAFAFAAFVAVTLLHGAGAGATARPSARRQRFALIVVAVAIAAGIALSRVALGVHFPGDVAAGAVVGSALGGVGGALAARRARPG